MNTLKIASLILVSFVTACGVEQPSDYLSVQDSGLRSIGEEFFAACEAHGNKGMKSRCSDPGSISIEFVESFPEPVNSSGTVHGEILIKKGLTGWNLKKTVFHELAHYLFAVESVGGKENCGAILYSGDTCIKTQTEWNESVRNFFSKE